MVLFHLSLFVWFAGFLEVPNDGFGFGFVLLFNVFASMLAMSSLSASRV